MGLPYALLFSADSETPMENMIQAAVDNGLTGICFTEHLDPDYPETPENLDFSLDIPAYRQRLLNWLMLFGTRSL